MRETAPATVAIVPHTAMLRKRRTACAVAALPPAVASARFPTHLFDPSCAFGLTLLCSMKYHVCGLAHTAGASVERSRFPGEPDSGWPAGAGHPQEARSAVRQERQQSQQGDAPGSRLTCDGG